MLVLRRHRGQEVLIVGWGLVRVTRIRPGLVNFHLTCPFGSNRPSEDGRPRHQAVLRVLEIHPGEGPKQLGNKVRVGLRVPKGLQVRKRENLGAGADLTESFPWARFNPTQKVQCGLGQEIVIDLGPADR